MTDYELHHKIIDLYENSDFFKIYGMDFWITVSFIIIMIILIIVIFITNHFNKIKQNWDTERCNPLYMPFAGFINSDNGKSNIEYVSENFTYCNNKFINKLETDAMNPIYSMANNINNLLNILINAWQSISGFINMIKSFILNIVQIVVDKLVAILSSLQILIIKIKDAIAKMIGTLVAMIYTFYNLYKVIKLYLLNIINIIVTEILISTILALVSAIGLLIALIITYIVIYGIGVTTSTIPFVGLELAIPEFTYAQFTLVTNIVILALSIAVMLIFDILIWIILLILHFFSKKVFHDINTPLPKRVSKIKSSDIKTTSDDSTNPMQHNTSDSQ